MSVWILDYIWLDGSERLCKLREAELGITIEVKAPHDGSQFFFDGLVAHSLEEATNGELIDDLIVVVVDGLEGAPDTETLELLQVLFELLKAQLEIDLLCE